MFHLLAAQAQMLAQPIQVHQTATLPQEVAHLQDLQILTPPWEFLEHKSLRQHGVKCFNMLTQIKFSLITICASHRIDNHSQKLILKINLL